MRKDVSPRAARRSKLVRQTPVFVSALEPRVLLSATGDGPAAAPVVHPLVPVDASLKQALGGARLLNAWSRLDSLTRPNSRAVSYLDLKAYSAFDVRLEVMKQGLANAPSQAKFARGEAEPLEVALPTPDGTYQRFEVVRSEVMEPALAAKYPGIRTFVGRGIDDPSASLAMDYTSQGFHASVRSEAGEYYIDPYFHLSPGAGAVAYWTDDNRRQFEDDDEAGFECLTNEDAALLRNASDGFAAGAQGEISPNLVSGTTLLGSTLRTYRLAVGSTGEYTAFHGGTVAGALAAITTTVVRMNQVYEADFAIHMNLVANENQVIYTNASSDPYTNPSNPGTTNNHNQTTLDNVIGSANYDVGHVYYRGSDNGLAGGLGTVGTAGIKGKGYTSFLNPVGDNFVIDYVAHELGHQFGGRHTFNNIDGDNGDSDALADEPGSGQSIMGYAGLGDATEDILIHSLPQFNANNYILATNNNPTQILSYTLTNTLSNGYTSAVKTATGNNLPSVQVDGSTFNVPVSTPFALTAYATDGDAGDTLTYSWEQMDGGAAVPLATVIGFPNVPSVPASNVNFGPVFRVFGATTNPTRTFPNLNAVLANRTYDPGERLPSVARSMKFAAIVRDNHTGGGAVALGRVNVNTVAGAVFTLDSLNSATSVTAGSSQPINWTNTNTAGGSTINAANVNILLSTDGGNTFPTTLAANVPNDGSETVTIPGGVATTTARIKLAAAGNVFFDVNNANFTVTGTPPTPSATPGAPDLVAATDGGTSSTDDRTNRDNSAAAKNLQFSVGSTVNGATVSIYADGTFIGSAVAGGSTTTVTTNGSVDLADGGHSLTARQTESGKSESPDSSSISVTIDTAAPTADVINISPDPRTTGVTGIAVDFNEAVGGFDVADLVLARNSGGNLLTASNAPTSGNDINFTVPNLLPLTSVAGNYGLTLNAAGSGITDLAGNALSATAADFWVHSLPAWLSASASAVTWNSLTKALTVTGSATITADPGSDNPAVSASGASAILTINPASGLAIHFSSLSLAAGATATVSSLGAARTAANHRVLVIGPAGSLSIDAGSKLNLTDNDLILDYTGSSPAADVEADVRTAYNITGNWLGNGITSSIAEADGNYVMAVADNALLAAPFGTAQGGPLFAGQNVDLTTVLVKFTHRSDLNLDGLINPDDSAVFGANYDESDTAFWSKGDLNFDGLFTPDDSAIFGAFYDDTLPLV